MMADLPVLLVWLAVTTVFLADGQVLVALMGSRFGPGLRQWFCAVPLVAAPALLVLTPWRPWMLAAICAALVARLTAHVWFCYRLMQRCRPAPPAVERRVADLAARWETPAPHRVLVGAGPLVLGLWRYTLILPAETAADDPDLAAAVAHELAHIRRRDPLKLWLVQVLAAPMGWHSWVGRNAARLRLEVELDADATAATWLRNPRAYALALARWALRQSGGPSWGTAMAHRPSELAIRLEVLLEPAADHRAACLAPWVRRLLAYGRNRPLREEPAGPRQAWLLVSLLALGYAVVLQGALWLL